MSRKRIMVNRLKRWLGLPQYIETSRTVNNWPQEAIDILHRGHKVTVVSDDYVILDNFVLQTYALPQDDVANIQYSKITVRLNELSVAFALSQHEIFYDLLEEDATLRAAKQISNFIMDYHRIYIKRGSYKYYHVVGLRPRWTMRAAVLFWLHKLMGVDMRWELIPGRMSTQRQLTVSVGWENES